MIVTNIIINLANTERSDKHLEQEGQDGPRIPPRECQQGHPCRPDTVLATVANVQTPALDGAHAQNNTHKKNAMESVQRPRQSRTKHRLDTTNSIYPLCKP